MPTIQSYHITLTGTPYENGRSIANFVQNDAVLNKNLADRLQWFDDYDKEGIDIEKAKLCEQKVMTLSPSFFDEIKGFTDALQISYEKYLYYLMFDWEIQSLCSQFCILPDITLCKKVYSGHSWEWTMEADVNNRIRTVEEDNVFITTKHNTKAYMGFTMNFFGFWNGMNKYGVSINPTGGIPLKDSSDTKKLCNHGLMVRLILETCTSSEEAVELIKEMIPLSSKGGGGTFIITDHSGKAYYIERAERHFTCVEVSAEIGKSYQCATNHFVNPEMFPYTSTKGVHSIIRYNAMNRWIDANTSEITMNTLLEMQQHHLPDGPCCHYYSAYLGTVRSMVYNLTDLKAMICYGSPRLNPWHAYDFSIQQTDIQKIKTTYINENADPEIWKHILPEEDFPA